MQKGIDHRQIKLHNYSIFIGNKLYCRVEGSQQQVDPFSPLATNKADSDVVMEQTKSDPPPRDQISA